MTDIQYKERFSQAELVDMIQAEQSKSENRNPENSICLYTKKCRIKTDAMARAITWHMAERRAVEGRPVTADGYSGRQTNRRQERTMENHEINRAFFRATDAGTRNFVLNSIADHYGISSAKAKTEITTPGAEHLLDYLTVPARNATYALMQQT